MYLTSDERQRIILKLTQPQKNALRVFSKLSQKSYFANVLASHKGTDRYAFEGFIDHGVVSNRVTCLCGKSLRYEFLLRDLRANRLISLGRTHFQRELDIPHHIARLVTNGLHIINIELDEILHKFERNDFDLPQSVLEHIAKLDLSSEIQCLRNAQLPLLKRHRDYLFDHTKKYRQPKKPVFQVNRSQPLSRQDRNSEYKEFEARYGHVIEDYFKNKEQPHEFRCRKERRLRSLKYSSVYRIMNYLINEKGVEKSAIFVEHPYIPYVNDYLYKNPNKYRVRPYTENSHNSEYKYVAVPDPLESEP
ncbi:hypothetical protein DFQ01_1508 [Paenibacillus cellulosilyticus]|uniref:Uncharacterized protein n=1 Tax=Paenibacillus cellulosilyticus TaxID=375489 RepID=A0A2V2YBK4_9BACL|nr:hypothetical protein [Paenibacillus cellulosilyticus]PWV88459.1 hypothetical protein DFQ01_1508 [Paenibacillus cellulosilyticus]QKS44094.1 hypothetical protein HUB94_06370 [Paenibacillus cellulosilyticus]